MKAKLEATYKGAPLDVLNRLIRERQEALQEDTSKAVIATAINVLVSLRADTRQAPKSGNKKMYKLERTNYTASWEKSGGKTRRVVRSAPRGGVLRDITAHCRNLAGQRYVRGERVKVYKATLFNDKMERREYYAFARTDKQMRDYIQKLILARILSKERGMARYALGVAAAKVSNKPMKTPAPAGAKQMRIAHAAGIVRIESGGWNSGRVSFHFTDDLEYSRAALKKGAASLDTAMMKAANKTAGLLTRAYRNKGLDIKVPTPFPEVKKRK